MFDSTSATYSDIKTKGYDFTFTGKLADYSVNDTWTESYKSSIGEDSNDSSLKDMWKTVRVGSEDVGNAIYQKILNYINEIGNIDTCDIDRLKEYGSTLGVTSSYLSETISFPKEIKELVNIFSINRAYLYNKATDGSEDTLAISNTILHYSTIEQFLDAFKSVDKYKSLIHNCIYNTLLEFLNMKNVTFDDSKNGITTTEIWKTDVNRFTNKLWNDDVESDDDIYSLKTSLSIDKSFTEKIYADDIIAGTRKLSDFTDSEQVVIKSEIENRKTRYNDANSMRYYYIRMYKVLEYFRFCATVYNSVYELSEYDLNGNNYTVSSNSDSTKNGVLIYNFDSYEINTSLIRKVTEWITDYILEISKLRTTMKSQCQKNTMVGTKRLLIDLIRKFIIDNIGTDVWNTSKNSILKNASLNKNFDVDIIEYVDTTDYTNIENENDSVSKEEHTLNPRFWENYNNLNNAISNEEVLSFFNRISDDERKFKTNSDNGTSDDTNLYEFLSVLFETGATNNTTSDYYLSSEVYSTNSNNSITLDSTTELGETAKNVIAKYSGDVNVGKSPYANDKNTFHPSYQIFPFIQAFEEYNESYSSIVNVVNSYTENTTESMNRLSKRLDEFGHTINFWHYWNDDFSGYTTTREKQTISTTVGKYVDCPYDFDALTELINFKDEYIKNLMSGDNVYYIDSSTGKCVLDEDEISTEISRLKKHYDKICMNAEREIYKYGKDYNGNIYILYKENGNRDNRSALGDIWIRMRNHPIAFPLFDITSKPSVFNTTSCVSETDNSKLIDILEKIISRFDSTYGFHVTNSSGYTDGSIIPKNISISYGAYSSTLPITSATKGVSSSPYFKYTYDDFNIENNPKLRLVTANSTIMSKVSKLRNKVLYDAKGIDGLSEYLTTTYFVDSVTNEIISPASESYNVIYKDDGNGIDYSNTVQNTTGRVVYTPDSEFFCAEYDNIKNEFDVFLNDNSTSLNDGSLVFMDYDDEIEVNGDTVYYRINNFSSSKTMHPCTKRTLTIKKIMKLSSEVLSGSNYVDDDGNVHFGGDIDHGSNYEKTTPYSSYDNFITTETTSSIVDGGLVYENFNNYRYRVTEGKGGETIEVDSSKVIMLGGSNPYYVYYDEDGEMQLKHASIIDSQLMEYEMYDFGDNIYRTDLNSFYISSFPVSDCVFKTTYGDTYSDTFGQFSLRKNPYKFYYPYTVISGEPFKDSTKGNGLPKGKITVRGKDGTDNVWYYNISSWDKNDASQHIKVKALKYNRYYGTVNITSAKFNGSFELVPENSSEQSIMLTFNDSGADNVATYSSYSSHQDQRKFFDMGFSYSQKIFYMSYYNDSTNYLDSGTIYGRFTESYDENYNTKLSFFRDTSHNLEYVDPSSMNVTDTASNTTLMHIGDCSSKKGILSAYARKYNPSNSSSTEESTEYIEIMLVLVTDTNIYKHKFNIPLRYALYEFSEGETYSLKLSCTVERAYVSMVTKCPADDDVLCNTIDESSIGEFGSTSFGKIKDKCGDSTITILSFDISDNDNFIYNKDETRYIMQSGTIGYFSQFSGIEGKNNIFANEKLSADSEFKFELKTDSLDTYSSEIRFYDEITSNITIGSSSEISEPIGRFINVYPTSSNSSETYELTGIVIPENGEYGYVVNASEDGGTGSKFVNFDGKHVYDVSRGIDSGVMFFADGDNTDTRLGAFVSETESTGYSDVNGLKKLKIPVQTELSGYYNTDFIELEDNGDDVYALCLNKKTIVRTRVSDRGDDFIPLSGIAMIDFSCNGIVDTYDDLPSVNSVSEFSNYKTTDDNVVYRLIDGEWTSMEYRSLSGSDIMADDSSIVKISTDSYENSSENGHLIASYSRNGSKITFFGAYGDKVIALNAPTIKQTYSYVSTPFFIGNVPYIIRYGGLRIVNEVYTIYYNIFKVLEDGKTERVMLDDGVTPHQILLDMTDPIKGIVNTYDNDIKMIYTNNGGIYKYTFKNNDIEISSTFKNYMEELDIEDYNLDVTMHESDSYLLITYHSDELSNGGVLHIRKNIPTSAATESDIYDINGKTASSVTVSKMLSIKDTVIFEDEESGLLFISYDDGLTFSVMKESAENGMTLVGCGTNKFYARYANGEKASSLDGIVWKNVQNIPFSDWNIVNANNIDYVTCEEYDDDVANDIVDRKKYVNIEEQSTLANTYDGIRTKDDIVVCYGGIDGKTPIRIARTDSLSSGFEEIEFKYSKGLSFSKAERNGNDLVFAPDGGSHVLVITDAFDTESEPSTKYIDITDTLNSTVNSFAGLETVRGKLIMYPSIGDRLLSFNNNISKFYNFYSFNSTMRFSDMDSIDGTESSDVILTSKYIESDGTLRFYKTNFEGTGNYGIVELDEGFPILVTYGKYPTQFTYGSNSSYDIYSITFTFMNDVNNRSVTIISKPNLDESENDGARTIIDDESEKSALYVSGNSSICYRFSTIDDGPRYSIKKVFK